MRFAPTDDQLEFRAAVRSLLADTCTPDDVRASWGGAVGVHTGSRDGNGRVAGAWSALTEMGVLGLTVPEALGGLGMTDDDLVPLLLECGWAGLPDPLSDTAGVAAAALVAAGADAAAATDWLGRIAGGATVVVGFGTDPLVASAPTADAFLLCSGAPGAGVEVHLLTPDAVGLEPVDSVDGSRALCRVAWEPSAATLLAGGAAGAAVAAGAFDRAATFDAALLVGLSRRMLDITVDYVAERQQFGVPIGSFQAVKHHLADAALGVQFAEPLVLKAAHTLSLGEPAGVDASMAKARASAAAQAMADAALQCHGAIGYTTECDLHLFMKRAWALSRTHGDAGWHRRRVRAALFGR